MRLLSVGVEFDIESLEGAQHQGELGRAFAALDVHNPLAARTDLGGEPLLRESSGTAVLADQVSEISWCANNHDVIAR